MWWPRGTAAHVTAGWLARVPHPRTVSLQGVIADLKLRGDPRAAERQCEEEEDDTEVSGDFGSGMEGGQQPSGKVEVSCCPQVWHSGQDPKILTMRRAECLAWLRSWHV
ncbi:hypothetical protein EK904_015215 [Melospiza melodia maxima]|nr:hypothetical protein EK904_015215 [Melospiza melodia maxima]